MTKEKTKTCCICGKKFTGYGNNPSGVVDQDENGDVEIHEWKEDDRCCDDCNREWVIPGRLFLIQTGQGWRI